MSDSNSPITGRALGKRAVVFVRQSHHRLRVHARRRATNPFLRAARPGRGIAAYLRAVHKGRIRRPGRRPGRCEHEYHSHRPRFGVVSRCPTLGNLATLRAPTAAAFTAGESDETGGAFTHEGSACLVVPPPASPGPSPPGIRPPASAPSSSRAASSALAVIRAVTASRRGRGTPMATGTSRGIVPLGSLPFAHTTTHLSDASDTGAPKDHRVHPVRTPSQRN